MVSRYRRTRLHVLVLILCIALAAPFSLTRQAYAIPTQFNVGDVLAGVGAGKVNLYSGAGAFRDQLDNTTASSEQTGMCFDADGNLYTTNFSAGSMSKFNSRGELLVANFGSGFSASPESCVVDAAGNIYVGQVNGANDVLKFDTSGRLLASFDVRTTDRGSDWIDLAADQCTLFYTSEGSEILRFNVCTNAQLANFATGLDRPCFALRIRPNGEVLVACRTQVYRLSSSGTVLRTYSNDSIDCAGCFLFALNLDPNGSSFWTGGISDGRIRKVNIDTGAVEVAFTATIEGGSMAGLAIVGEITVSQPPPPEEPPEEPEVEIVDPAFVTVAVRTTPSLGARPSTVDFGISSIGKRASVADDGIVDYVVEVTNRGKGGASNATLIMPFDAAEQRLLDATFSRAGAWVSRIVTNSLEIQTGQINAGDTISATVRLLVRPGVAAGTDLGERILLRWGDRREGGAARSNLVPLEVTPADVHSPFLPMFVDPAAGPAESTRTFATNVFVPLEPVSLWYNRPNGTAVAVARFSANDDGAVGITASTTGLPPGRYSMVAYGEWSRFTSVGVFDVR